MLSFPLYCCIVEFGDIGWAGNLIFFHLLLFCLYSVDVYALSPCHLVPPLAALHCFYSYSITTYNKHLRVRLIRKQLKNLCVHAFKLLNFTVYLNLYLSWLITGEILVASWLVLVPPLLVPLITEEGWIRGSEQHPIRTNSSRDALMPVFLLNWSLLSMNQIYIAWLYEGRSSVQLGNNLNMRSG